MTAGRHHGLHRRPSQLSLASLTPSMVSLLPLWSVTVHSETDYRLVAEGLDLDGINSLDRGSARLRNTSVDTWIERGKALNLHLWCLGLWFAQSHTLFGPLRASMADLGLALFLLSHHGQAEMDRLTAFSGGCLGGWPMDLHKEFGASDNQRACAD